MTPPASNLPSTATTALEQLVNMGGPVMWLLLGLAVVGLVAFFYLVIAGALFAPRLTRNLRRLVDQWQQQPDDNSADQVGASCGWRAKTNPMTKMVATAMHACRQQREAADTREELARQSQQALKPFEAPLKVIEVIAALAPLLGLLGTVMGMMSAFSSMSVAEGQANASQLSGGIYEALTTTAAGLVLAIPFAAIAAWAEFRMRRLNLMMNDTLVKVITTPVSPANMATKSSKKSAPETTPQPRNDRFDVAYATG